MPAPEVFSHATQAVRFDGIWWRKLAQLGSVHGPEWLKCYSPPVIATLLFVLVAKHRRGATYNLERVLEVDRRTAGWAALRMFSEFARCMSEAMEEAARPGCLRLDRPGDDPMSKALRVGRGVVAVTAHFGGWQVAASALTDFGRPVNVVMARETNDTTREVARRTSEQDGVRVVFGDASVFAGVALMRALERNEVVAFQIDRMVGSAGVRRLPFLGAPATFPSGPFVLGRLSGAPVIPVFAPRLGRRHYRMHVGRGVEVPREARDPQLLDDVMLDVVGELETMIRRYPLQWFCFHPFWTQTGGDAPERLGADEGGLGGRSA